MALLVLRSSHPISCMRRCLLVPFIAPVTILAASYCTLSIYYPYKLAKQQIAPYERLLITLFLQVALSALKDPFFPPLLPCGMTLVLICLQSIGPFKKALFSFFNVPSYNVIYDFAIDRFNAVIRTRLRLDACGLNYYLFKIGYREHPLVFVVSTLRQLSFFS